MQDELIKTLLEVGRIKRCHNLDIHGTYTVGRHSFGVASIILRLHPDPSVRLLRAALWHDAPERYLGDLPAPAKWYNPALAREYQLAEEKVLEHMGLGDLVSCLTEEERAWLHGADRLELVYWCRTQKAMGNDLVDNVCEALREWFSREHTNLPPEICTHFVGDDFIQRTKEDIR